MKETSAYAPFERYDVASCRARIAARNAELNAVLHVIDDVVDGPRSQTATAPLAGVPYVLKDTWDTAGIPTTGGSWRHRTRVPVASSHVHRALEGTGAVLLGKSNLCDLAFSTESDNHLAGPVRNPFDPTRTAGGSTGGGAAAVADGMAAFDWGSDFGGSIRGPAAFCGIVGLRLAASTWPIEYHHFPRIAPFFWELCGMGPLTRDVAGARALVATLAGSLRKPAPPAPAIERDRVVVWAPDAPHAGEWPSFVDDATRLLDAVGVTPSLGGDLPSPTEINALFTEYLSAHFDELLWASDIPLHEGLVAVALGLLSGGRLDRRIHPNTAALFGALFALRLRHRDKVRAAARVGDVRARVRAIWESGTLIVSPTSTLLPPRHGRAAFALRLMSFCKLGNLVDATALALPFGHFPNTTLPRSLQILGPPGSEAAVLDLAARLEARVRQGQSKPTAASISNIASAASGVA